MNTNEQNQVIDSVLMSTVNRQLVKWAAGHVMFCPGCDQVLDCRSTVVASHNTGGQTVLCGACWDRKTELYAYSEIVDGRKLWASPAPRKPKQPRAKHTFAERLERGLQALGWTRDWTDKSRYAAWAKAGELQKLFTGPSGALRKGECASRSYSIGDPTRQTGPYAQLLEAGDKALAS